jgi:predicted ABC-type transport system involved in lysophospholipase L1 biosynthesis ATPase subunit
MNDEKDEQLTNAPVIAIVACAGAGASSLIALIAFLNLHQITDLGMVGIALMVAAPCAMAFGIAYALIKHGKGP